MRLLMIPIAATMVAACQTATEQPTRTASQQQSYDRALAGKTAGKAEKCLPTYRSNDMSVIDDHTILFRDGRTTYVNSTLGNCSGLGDSGHALVTRNVGPQLCRGDIATVVDTSTGMTVGSCSMGDFVPYRAVP
ncbi:MAG: hypothetical protein ABI667_02725 [Sphingomicrobium sp.]